MYKSLRKWLRVPIIIKPFIEVDGAGDKLYGAERSALCYAEDKVQIVVNREGTEVKSTTTLYVDGAEQLSEDDLIMYTGRDKPIKALASLYDTNGIRDIWMVYV